MPAWLREMDERLFLWLNGSLHRLRSGPLADVLRLCDALGSWFALVVLGIASALLGAPGRARLRRPVQTVIAGGLVAAAVRLAKAGLSRARPPRALAEAFSDGRASIAFGESLKGSGFPSGHTATAFVAATLLSAWARRAGRSWAVALLPWPLAIGTGVARVYAGIHFPLDVVAGGLLGIVAGLVGVAVGNAMLRDREGPSSQL
jgi:undecaprenyl-diphosphatase